MFRLLAFFLFFFISKWGLSQMAFQNKTPVVMLVAFGYYKETSDYSGWVTEGWYSLKPGEKVVVINKPLDSEYYYYYAESADSAIEFRGEILLKVGVGKFAIEDADQNVSFKGKNHRFFKQIDTEDKKNFLIVLHETYIESK